MAKSLRKAIMLRFRLKSNVKKGLMKNGIIMRSKGISVLNTSARPKKNILVILVSKAFLTKKIWKAIKPFFSNKSLTTNKTMLVQNNKIVREEEMIANIMNNYFKNVTSHS